MTFFVRNGLPHGRTRVMISAATSPSRPIKGPVDCLAVTVQPSCPAAPGLSRVFVAGLSSPDCRRGAVDFYGSSQVIAGAFLSPAGTFADSHAAQARGKRMHPQESPAGRLKVSVAPPALGPRGGLRINECGIHALAPRG